MYFCDTNDLFVSCFGDSFKGNSISRREERSFPVTVNLVLIHRREQRSLSAFCNSLCIEEVSRGVDLSVSDNPVVEL